MRTRNEARLVDTMISASIDTRQARRVVHDAYRSWANATGPRARAAFWRYTAALDARDLAADVYASHLRVWHPTNNYDLSGLAA
jgi:hypothetical protein